MDPILAFENVGRREMLGALAVVVGITLFLSVGSPKGGTNHPNAATWWAAGLTSLVLVGIAVELGRRGQGATRALLFGSAGRLPSLRKNRRGGAGARSSRW